MYDQMRSDTMLNETQHFYFHKHLMHGCDVTFTLSNEAFFLLLAYHSSENIIITVLKKKKSRHSRKNLRKRKGSKIWQPIANVAYRCLRRELVLALANDLEVLKEITVIGIFLYLTYNEEGDQTHPTF